MASNLPSAQKENWAPNEVVKPEHTNSWGHAINTLSKAVPLYSACGNVYTATYADNVYNLMPLSFTENTSNVTVDSYVDGMSVIFQCPTDNLANCSVNVNSLGTKIIKTIDNVNLPAGKLNSGVFVELKYDKTNDCFKFQQDFNKADRNFSNLTEEAEKHFLNKSQITNCILEAPNGVATYEGNVITAKAGLKVLLCDGKNADGTYKNIEYTLASDISLTNGNYISDKRFISVGEKGKLAFDDGASFVFGTKEPANPYQYLCWYNPDTNIFKQWLNNMWNIQNRAVIGWFTATSSTITSLTVYSTLNLLKQSDKSQISGWSMPSDKFVPLTFGPSDSIYIAPASGRFSIRAKATAPYAFMNLLNLNNGLLDISDLTLANDECGLSVEAKKGDRVGLYYANFTVPSTGYFRFIYAEGEA